MLTREQAIASIIAADPAQNFPVMASSDVELLINQIYDEHEVQMKEANRIKEDFRKVALDLDAEASELREQMKAKDEEIRELEEAQLTRREWYQKGYNEAMKPNKTCSSCKYWDFNEQGHFKKCFNGKGNVVSTEADFCCNRYYPKDNA